MTEHKELATRARKLGNQPNPGENLAEWIDFASLYLVQSADAIEEQAVEIARLTKERGVAVGALERVAADGVSSLDKAIAEQAVEIARLRDALKGLLADIEEYQQINNLGGENNHWQVIARAALTHPPETGS